MASQPPQKPPESIILGQFSGLKNTVSDDRLAASELARATNVDIDDVGQISRRRGQTQVSSANWRSIRDIDGKLYGVKDGVLGIVRPDYSFKTLTTIGSANVCYTEVAGEIYFSSTNASGVVKLDETLIPWGKTSGQGTWLSPVRTPTATLGEVGGTRLGDPPNATSLAAYKGRIYLAVDKLLWATELFAYHFVDRTKNFMQFEDTITMVAAMSDGLYVGTAGGLYFMRGTFEAFRPLEQFTLTKVSDYAVLPGSDVIMPAEMVHPQARTSPMPMSQAVVCMTTGGIVAGFDSGSVYNLTLGQVEFPVGVSAAGLYRREAGVTHYIAAVDSAGGPGANARMGDYVEAEIRRFGG